MDEKKETALVVVMGVVTTVILGGLLFYLTLAEATMVYTILLFIGGSWAFYHIAMKVSHRNDADKALQEWEAELRDKSNGEL